MKGQDGEPDWRPKPKFVTTMLGCGLPEVGYDDVADRLNSTAILGLSDDLPNVTGKAYSTPPNSDSRRCVANNCAA